MLSEIDAHRSSRRRVFNRALGIIHSHLSVPAPALIWLGLTVKLLIHKLIIAVQISVREAKQRVEGCDQTLLPFFDKNILAKFYLRIVKLHNAFRLFEIPGLAFNRRINGAFVGEHAEIFYRLAESLLEGFLIRVVPTEGSQHAAVLVAAI